MSSLSLIAIPNDTCVFLTVQQGLRDFGSCIQYLTFLFIHGIFSECVFNIQQALFIVIVHCVMWMSSNPSTATESGDHRGRGRELWWTV